MTKKRLERCLFSLPLEEKRRILRNFIPPEAGGKIILRPLLWKEAAEFDGVDFEKCTVKPWDEVEVEELEERGRYL